MNFVRIVLPVYAVYYAVVGVYAIYFAAKNLSVVDETKWQSFFYEVRKAAIKICMKHLDAKASATLSRPMLEAW